jgi:hypothetical protein
MKNLPRHSKSKIDVYSKIPETKLDSGASESSSIRRRKDETEEPIYLNRI